MNCYFYLVCSLVSTTCLQPPQTWWHVHCNCNLCSTTVTLFTQFHLPELPPYSPPKPLPLPTLSDLNPETYITPGKSSSHYKHKGQFSFTFVLFLFQGLYHSEKKPFHNMWVTDFPCVCSPWRATEKIIQTVHFTYHFAVYERLLNRKSSSRHKERCLILIRLVVCLLSGSYQRETTP